MPSFYEFFAGGGMARTGLGRAWKCEFANDISPMKAAAYLRNFKESDNIFAQCDVNELDADSLPGAADLIWASFPCQDLSLAGSGRGLNGSRSGLIWSLLEITRKLKQQGRGPKAIVLENALPNLSRLRARIHPCRKTQLLQCGFSRWGTPFGLAKHIRTFS